MARLLQRYRTEIVPHLQKELGHANVFQVPRVSRVVLNMGLGEAIQNAKALDAAVAEIGCMVTLRGMRMYEFLDRLMNVALPRVRDFRGVSDRSFDGRGNYSLGIREQIIFPEIDLDKIEKVRGLTVSIVTTARSDAEGKALLKALGMPFRA
jgi:large subunit ribosomal protein L5